MKKLYSILAMLFVSLATLSAQNTVFIGETGYGSLAEAVEAATDGATITIKGDQSFTGNRINITGKTLQHQRLRGSSPPVAPHEPISSGQDRPLQSGSAAV